jgi:hypothetical protein
MPRHSIALLKLWVEERRVQRDMRKAIAELEACGKSEHEVWMGIGEHTHAQDEVNERRRYLNHEYLVKRARRLSISPPLIKWKDMVVGDERDSNWERLTLTRVWVLQPEATRRLRSEVREELKARRDYALGWLTPFLGLISTLAGVILGYFLGSRK